MELLLKFPVNFHGNVLRPGNAFANGDVVDKGLHHFPGQVIQVGVVLHNGFSVISLLHPGIQLGNLMLSMFHQLLKPVLFR